jgi:outer membrane protein assembly factor BamB
VIKINKAFVILIIFIFQFSFLLPSLSVNGEVLNYRGAKSYGTGYRYNIQGWVYVHIEGDPYERGYQHGYLLANEIMDMRNRWAHTIHLHPAIRRINSMISESGYQKVSEIWWDFCRNQINRIYWDKFPDEYKNEIYGIADGVKYGVSKLYNRAIDYKDILAINEMYEFMSKLDNLRMGLHFLRVFFHQLQKIEPSFSTISEDGFLSNFLAEDPPHHCNGFIATGDATSNGQMVFSHTTICTSSMWWWNYYIALRWNVILDISPSRGNRVIMSASPGLIWSDEDYYQNDNGIVLLETTNPQGFFDNIGLPLSVRARNAMQYGNSIDDVVYSLRHKNDGSMNAVWLIGDSKTGEIARFELGYSNFALYRTFNGFYWSANNPLDIKVRTEKFKLDFDYFYNLMNWILKKGRGIAYHSIRYFDSLRDMKFEELGNKYYGDIDIDVVKEIMVTVPISSWISDIKVTDSNLIEKNGLWIYYGNPTKSLNYTSYDSKINEKYGVKPNGWARIFGIPLSKDFRAYHNDSEIGGTSDVIWSYDTKENSNDFSSSGIIKDDVLYVTASIGKIYAIEPQYGFVLWEKDTGKYPTKPVINDGEIFIGHLNGISVFDLNGTFTWDINAGKISTSPVFTENELIFGDDEGRLCCYSLSGDEKWVLNFPDEVYVAERFDNKLYVTSGVTCYSIDINTHEIIWEYESDNIITQAPLLEGDVVYFCSWDNNIFALDSNKGSMGWVFEMGWGSDTIPVVSNDTIFVGGTDNNLYALKAKDGMLKWVFSCDAAIHSQHIAYGDHVYFGSDDGRFYAINKTNGKCVWNFSPNHIIKNDLLNYITTPVLSTPIAHNGIIYIGINGTIYALDAQTIEKHEPDNNGPVNFQSGISYIIFLALVTVISTIIILFIKKNMKKVKQKKKVKDEEK